MDAKWWMFKIWVELEKPQISQNVLNINSYILLWIKHILYPKIIFTYDIGGEEKGLLTSKYGGDAREAKDCLLWSYMIEWTKVTNLFWFWCLSWYFILQKCLLTKIYNSTLPHLNALPRSVQIYDKVTLSMASLGA